MTHRGGTLLALAITLSTWAMLTMADAQSWRDRGGNSAADRVNDRGWRGQGNSGG